jgi:2-keto-4-pentenoate hydratase/2-oxohepta-3-ene-1,7-dioic acid hydratase in catechol pathway
VKIVRFSCAKELDLGSDPLYGVLNDQDSILVLRGDPIYTGIVPQDQSVKLSEVKLLAPVIPRSKVVCIGKNYADHAAEMDSNVPEEPIIFIKPNTAVIGPNEKIIWPKMSERVDHEAELAIVISRICKQVPAEKSKDVIFGYTMANDVTARDLQKKDGQWSRAKGFDTFCPLGPWIDTEFLPNNQKISATLNGELKQSADLSLMIFKVPKIIEFVTNVMTLLPGDVILTGTPAGIGPMPADSTISVSIEGLGTLTNKVSSRVN